jgi:beta-lactamase class A
MTRRAGQDIERTFDEAGLFGCLHAVNLHDPTREVAVRADEPIALASVVKLPVLVGYAHLVDAGELDPAERVELDPQERTPGPTGVAAMTDPVVLAWRDLARSMMAVSDNAAADALLDRIGLARVQTAMDGLGLDATRVAGGLRDLFASVVADSGVSTLAEAVDRLRDPVRLAELTALDPANPAASVSTGRDLTRLLAAIWHGQATSPGQAEFIRTVMAQQVWTQRLAAAFPFDDVVVAGKTGSFASLRHEVGVVEYPNGETYAIAVLTQSDRPRWILPGAEAAIAQAAKLAVAALR